MVVRYRTVDDPAVQAEYAPLLAHFAEEHWPLPVALLDGEVLFVGGVQPLKLVAAVAERLLRE